MTLSGRQIFVDDTDPHIKYGKGWTAERFTTANDTYFPISPLYGTLHVFNSGSLLSTNLSYEYNGQLSGLGLKPSLFYLLIYLATTTGTSISAIFGHSTPPGSITGCFLDGQQLELLQTAPQSTTCSNLGMVTPDGPHELIIQVKPEPPAHNPILFDGIQYSPSSAATIAGDVVYGQEDPAINMEPKTLNLQGGPGTLDLDFFGQCQAVIF